MSVSHLQKSRLWEITGLFLCYLAVPVARGWASLDRIPADPGYGWVVRASERGIASIFTADPHLNSYELLVAWGVHLFPIASHATLMAISTHLTWATGALLVALVMRGVTSSLTIAVFSGLVIVLSPHASESVLGNIGNTRWILLITVATVISVPPALRPRGVWFPILAIVTGFSNPIAGICLVPIAGRRIRSQSLAKPDLILILALGSGALVQILLAVSGKFWRGHDVKVTRPWNGMGAFWWSGLVGPFIISTTVLLVLFAISSADQRLLSTARWLAVLSVLIHTACYLLGGIADRYFVAPMTLSVMAVLLTVCGISQRFRIHRTVLLMLFVVVFALPAIKWFSASRYLSSGPTWNSEVQRATEQCTDPQVISQSLALSPSGVEELNCKYILRNHER